MAGLMGQGLLAAKQSGLHFDHAATHPETRTEFTAVERFGYIVIRSRLQSGDDVSLLIPSGQHQDIGRLLSLQAANPTGQV